MDDRPTEKISAIRAESELISTKPPSWVTAGVLFIASIAGGGGTGFLTTSYQVEALEHDLAEHEQSDGHAASLARLRNLEERVAVQSANEAHMRQLFQSIERRLAAIEDAVTNSEQRPRRR
jgi:hypothetical protein